MKTLIVYYSLDGHTRLIADILAGSLNGASSVDVFELRPLRETQLNGFLKYFVGGMRAIFGAKPALQTPLPDAKAYDLICLGTPVWGGRFTPPVNTFISGTDLACKKVLLLATSAGGDASKCFASLKARLASSEIIGEIGFKSPTPASRAILETQISASLADLDI